MLHPLKSNTLTNAAVVGQHALKHHLIQVTTLQGFQKKHPLKTRDAILNR